MRAIIIRKELLFLALFVFLIFPTMASAQVRISGLNDFSFGSWDGVSDISSSDQFCIWSGQGNSLFMTAIGNGSNNTFQLRGSANNLDMKIEFRINQGAYIQLEPNKFSPFINPRNNTPNCFGGSNAELKVTIPQSSLESGEEGFYYGQLILMVMP
ncbi:MAG: hypothetical protein KBC84_00620 [Proteobacteria bacterium]|nr:hypothetical protein [Pseudomonadota bacterium]